MTSRNPRLTLDTDLQHFRAADFGRSRSIPVPDGNARSLLRGFTIVELLIVIVVIAILAAITIAAYNGITNKAKTSALASEVAQWQKRASLQKIQNEIECPENYAFVYGNSAFGTSDFCVMKYEAKIQGSDNGSTTYVASMAAQSRADGTPWVNISQSNAITEAAEAGGHVMTEAEWMTIAADVLSVKYNWSGGAVGSGYIYQGHVNSNPASALAASADDNNPLVGITGGVGTSPGTNSQRTLLLSTGDTIWDFSGNALEWTQQAVGVPTLTTSQIGISGDASFAFRQYTLGGLSFGNLSASSRPSALASSPGLSSIGSWTSSQGIGQLYANYADAGVRAFARGGNWSSTSGSGVLSLYLSNQPTYPFANVGFRVVR